MARRTIEIGAVGRRLAENLAVLREDRRLSQEELAARLRRLGRPMSGPVVSKTEQLDRRVDVDDLMALAVALDTPPDHLLLPATARADELVELTPETKISELDAWRWAVGEFALTGSGPARRLQALQEGMPHHAAAVETKENRMAELIERNPDLVRMIVAVVDEARARGADEMLLDLLAHIEIQRRFGLPVDGTRR